MQNLNYINFIGKTKYFNRKWRNGNRKWLIPAFYAVRNRLDQVTLLKNQNHEQLSEQFRGFTVLKSTQKSELFHLRRRNVWNSSGKRYLTVGSVSTKIDEDEYVEKGGFYFRRAEERGVYESDWIKTLHSFHFLPNYNDEQHRGFSRLRAANEHFLKGGRGFDAHLHTNMELITMVMKGSLQHNSDIDSTLLKPDEVQVVSAGKGLMHSEMNTSAGMCHFLQFWVVPDENVVMRKQNENVEPMVKVKKLDKAKRMNRWQLIVSQTGKDGSLKIHQDVNVFLTTLNGTAQLVYERKERNTFVHVIEGRCRFEEKFGLHSGDGVGIERKKKKKILFENFQGKTTLILFDLP